MLDSLSTLVPVLVAISLASERLIAILKSLIPALKDERKTAAGEVDLQADRGRQLTVQAVALATSYVTVALAFSKWSPTYSVPIGGNNYSVAALALLGSGGSAFWNNVFGYTKAVKDVRTAQKATVTLDNRLRAEQHGLVTDESRLTGARSSATDRADTLARRN